MMIDCRDVPSESGCTLTIAGEPDEVLRAAAAHAVDVHGHADGEELRNGLREALREASDGLTPAGAFIQVIEFRTRRIDEFDDVTRQWADAIGPARTARWDITGADLDEADSYLQIVEFPDRAAAMSNSDHPATSAFADRLRKLCDSDPTFHNLEVHQSTVF
ncbi:DUF1059 domain-containing protein [Actinomycetospora endophytica]|nr:DUF1059 domain-containing protein [Actinomycetospora endophytica]